MKNIIGLHRDYGILVRDETLAGKRYIDVDTFAEVKTVQTGGYITLTEQDLLSRLKLEVNRIIRKAEYFGLTPDQIQSILPVTTYSDRVKDLARAYKEACQQILTEEFLALSRQERTERIHSWQSPILDLVGDTWANRFNFDELIDDILKVQN